MRDYYSIKIELRGKIKCDLIPIIKTIDGQMLRCLDGADCDRGEFSGDDLE
ncbi:hypothetical protein [Moorena sp. SIO4G3]|uniref:hypothetical protein n=1 Tax=Moorena sp. SIO4G3 TaxID=2607821 RepID=UPI00142C8F76|nr:hypothetical protein [Moorena sp. SIO4G3]NEO78645.1 hypothetical protein [Moorena sp. SIO4G3]